MSNDGQGVREAKLRLKLAEISRNKFRDSVDGVKYKF